MWTDSLGLRLILTSALWVVGTLLVTGLLLVLLFRDHIERRFDLRAQGDLESLVAVTEPDPDGAPRVTHPLVNPNYARPHSGWYWQVLREGAPVAQSESLWYARLAIRAPQPGGRGEFQEFPGPGGEPLRALVREISLPVGEGTQRLVYGVAAPVADIQRDVWSFTANLVITLTALGLGLIGAVVLQVRVGLSPLRTLGEAVGRIRAGQARRLPERVPREVRPVVRELNALLEHNAALLERARTQAGNLAHALKNPISVIRNEVQTLESEQGRILREQVAAISAHLERHLSQARAAGTGNLLGARTAVAAVVDDLRYSLDLLYRERGLEIQVGGLDGLIFRGDAQDLEEMLGNPMDNACKWARQRVRVTGERHGEWLWLRVEDDGPGIPEGARAAAPRRGQRLDETVPGSGLGLAIVGDLVDLYRGEVRLGVSEWGGARVELGLPGADMGPPK